MYNTSIDQSNMFKSISEFSEHIANSFDYFNQNSSINSDISKDINSILILGMGGSAITGLLFKEILSNKLDIPISVNQGYTIPKWVNNDTLVIACSYSGNTEETLVGLEKCKSKTSKIIGFTTGGKLYEFIQKFNFNYVLMPKGLSTRVTLGYSFTLMLLLLNKIGFINEKTIIDLKNNINVIIKFSNVFSKNNNENLGFSLAEKIYDKNPIIYAEDGIFGIIGYRFKCQLVENSKILAFNNIIPEMNHNEIEAYTKDVNNNNNFIILWINNENYHSRNKKRIEVVKKIFSTKIKDQIEINLNFEKIKNPIVQYLVYINLLDWISYHAAILKNIDPTIIPNINELKKSL